MTTPTETEYLNFFFGTIPLSEVPVKPIITIPSDYSITRAVKVLADHNILAAPVVNVAAPDGASWSEKYSGIVDMIGVAFYVLDTLKHEHTGIAALIESHSLETTPVSAIAGTARWGPFVPLDVKDTLLDALLLMGEYGLHRIPVVQSPGGDIVTILTQSFIVGELAKHMDQFEVIGKKTLEALGLASPQKCISVRIDDKLADAVELIRVNNISAVPVLGVDGAVVGNISARDLRTLVLNPTLFRLLSHPVRQFLAHASSVEHEGMNPAVTCRPHDTLEHIIQQLAVTRIHRIYVCDDRNRPLRVLALTDVLKAFVKKPTPDYFGKYQF